MHHHWPESEVWLARAILSLADSADMPDSFWQTDQRVAFARSILGVAEDERYEKEHLWDEAALYEGG